MLATTPELLIEPQPFEHPETGCVITADVRLDNREELIAALDVHRDPVGDAEIILGTYLKWGGDCPNHLLGDFAFAIWDPRHKRVFCARDHSGMRQLYYHHKRGSRFLFATEARAILVLPQVPYHLNEGRIADFLIQELEMTVPVAVRLADLLGDVRRDRAGPRAFTRNAETVPHRR